MTNDEIEDVFWNGNGESCVVREDTAPAPPRMYDTCKKEAREAKHFLRMVVRAVPELKPKARPLWREAKELHLIFAKIRRGANESHSFVIRHLSFVIPFIPHSSFF
jgi:hypothetical protein